MNDRDLLAIQAGTNFVRSHGGRLLRTNEPRPVTAPRLYFAGCPAGNIFRIGNAVSDATARALERLAAIEPPLSEPEAVPVHLGEYLRLLGSEAPIQATESGPNWIIPDDLLFEHAAPLVRSATPEGDALLARLMAEGMPEALVALGFVSVADFWEPWCVALDGDEIASIAFAARIGPASAETGVASAPAFRGRGFAAAATAGWASHPALRGRPRFYSTSTANLSSQRVAQRLGLRFIGASFSIK